MSEEKSGQKLVHHMIKGSFHKGSIYIFDTETAGHQCVSNYSSVCMRTDTILILTFIFNLIFGLI